MKHILEELTDLEYDVRDTLSRLIDRIEYINKELVKDYYIDISCENKQSSDVINDLLVNEKKSLSKEYIKHRLDTLELCYTPWIITNRPFYFKKGRAIKGAIK